VRRSAHQHRRDRRAVDVTVVAEDARCADDERRVFVRVVGVVDRDGRVVDRRDGDLEVRLNVLFAAWPSSAVTVIVTWPLAFGAACTRAFASRRFR
jgi:hypothetical protein